MDDYKIILFCCNWGPHAAYLNLQDRQKDIQNEIKMVRIPCSGRISKALLFKPFEMGADGVVLLGCGSGTCRYGSGTASALKNTSETSPASAGSSIMIIVFSGSRLTKSSVRSGIEPPNEPARKTPSNRPLER